MSRLAFLAFGALKSPEARISSYWWDCLRMITPFPQQCTLRTHDLIIVIENIVAFWKSGLNPLCSFSSRSLQNNSQCNFYENFPRQVQKGTLCFLNKHWFSNDYSICHDIRNRDNIKTFGTYSYSEQINNYTVQHKIYHINVSYHYLLNKSR